MFPLASPRFVSVALLVAALGSGLSAQEAVGAEDRAVPAVTGKPVEEAADVLRRGGFGVRVIEVAGPAAGQVAEQDPPAGQRLVAGATVTVRVGVQTRVSTTMPNVVGLAPEDALAALGQAYDVRVTSVEVPAARAGRVLATRPNAGEQTPFRSSVYVVVGVPPGPRVLPGDPGTPEATTAPVEGPPNPRPGPNPAPVPAPLPSPGPAPTSAPASSPPPPVVAPRTTPPTSAPTPEPLPASEVPLGMRIRVPDVMGKNEHEALRALARVGLRVEVLRIDDPAAPQGVVLLQMPVAGEESTSGADVYLKIAGGTARPTAAPASEPPSAPAANDGGFADGAPPAYGTLNPSTAGTAPVPVPEGMSATPNLIGLDVSAASAAITSAQLVPHPWYVEREGLPAWQVIAQKDAAGTPLAHGDAVHFRVVRAPAGEGTIPMPSLFGLNKEQATNVIRGLGLPLSARLVDPGAKVTLQRPLAGSQVPWGTPIGIVVGPIDDVQRLQATPEEELISEAAAAALLQPQSPPSAPSTPTPPRRRSRTVFDRIGDFIDDAADEVRDKLR